MNKCSGHITKLFSGSPILSMCFTLLFVTQPHRQAFFACASSPYPSQHNILRPIDLDSQFRQTIRHRSGQSLSRRLRRLHSVLHHFHPPLTEDLTYHTNKLNLSYLYPRQSRGPADQGRNVQRGGSRRVSHGDWPPSSHRKGRKASASALQIVGEMCMSAAPTWTYVSGAKFTSLTLCGPVVLRAMCVTGVNRRRRGCVACSMCLVVLTRKKISLAIYYSKTEQ